MKRIVLHTGFSSNIKNLRTLFLTFKYNILKKFISKDYALNYIAGRDTRALVIVLRREGAHIGNNVSINLPIVFHEARDLANLAIGNDVHVGKMNFFDLTDRITIGNRVTISMGCVIVTHIDLGKSALKAIYPRDKGPVRIDDDVYIACNSTILPGVSIQRAAFIAAGSLLNRDVTELTMVAGMPAIRKKSLTLDPGHISINIGQAEGIQDSL